MRRIGEIPSDKIDYQKRPGVYVVLPRDGLLLLTYQDELEPEFQLPGGGIDPGESPLQALHREVMEETGWSIGSPRRLGAFRRFCFLPDYKFWAEKICAVYIARPVSSIQPPTEAGHTVVWADPKAAVNLLGNPGDRAFVKSLYDL